MFAECAQDAGWACRKWNARWAGREAFTASEPRGYRQGMVCGHHLRAHQAIWAMQTGEWSALPIDHANGDTSDNRWVNLRAVTQQVNASNSRLYANNTSGAVGVFWDIRREKWSANIRQHGRQRFLGYFDLFADAVAARKAAELGTGISSRHGS
jgi:hypothetical protein